MAERPWFLVDWADIEPIPYEHADPYEWSVTLPEGCKNPVVLRKTIELLTIRIDQLEAEEVLKELG